MNQIESQDKIEKVVELRAPVSRVWQAITDHKQFGEWFHVRLDQPFEVGKTTTGQVTYAGYEDMKWTSVTERLEPETLFVFSWPPGDMDPDTEYASDAKVVVEFKFEPTESGTRLTITESGFLQFPEAKRLEILRGNTEGWNSQAENIANYVSN